MPQEAVYKGEFKFHGWSFYRQAWELKLDRSAPEKAELIHWKSKGQEAFILKVDGKEAGRWVEGDEAVAELTPGGSEVVMTPRTDQIPLAGYGIYLTKQSSRFVVKEGLRNKSNFNPCDPLPNDCRVQSLNFDMGSTFGYGAVNNGQTLVLKMNGIEREKFELGPMVDGWPSTINSKAWDHKGILSYEGIWRLESVGPSSIKSMNWEDGLKPGMNQTLYKNKLNVHWKYTPGQKGIWKIWETQNSMHEMELVASVNKQSTNLGQVGLTIALASLACAFAWQMGRRVSHRAAKS